MSTEERDLPTAREISELSPPRRRGYAEVRRYLGLSDEEKRESAGHLVRRLAEEQHRMEPPLEPKTADAINAFEVFRKDLGPLEDYSLTIDFLAQAIFEHGYGNGNNG